jgi:hypothetical protein
VFNLVCVRLVDICVMLEIGVTCRFFLIYILVYQLYSIVFWAILIFVFSINILIFRYISLYL